MELGIMPAFFDRGIRLRKFGRTNDIASQHLGKKRSSQIMLFEDVHNQRHPI